MTLPIGTAEERELIEPVAKALYEDWVAEDFANEYAPWELLADKATWLSRAAVAATALQSRIAEVEALLERVGVLEEALEFYGREWTPNLQGDPGTLELGGTWNKPTVELWSDAGYIARASLTQGGE